jgi:drug/metabolite transporter (DMT)-like permease
MESKTPEERKFIVGMILSMLCWGISWPSAKVLASYGSAESIGLFRFVVTFLSLAPLLLVIKEPLKIQKRGILILLLAGISLSFYSYFFLQGVKIGKAGAGGVLVTTMNPIFTAILIMILQKEFPKKIQLIGLGIGLIAGIILLRLWDTWSSLELPALYFLLATAIWAVLSRFTSFGSSFGSSLSFSMWMYLVCSLIMACFTSMEENKRILAHTDVWFWVNLIFSSTVTTAGATTFYFLATTKIGAEKASTFMFMVPLSAALGSWVLLSEVPKWNTLVGGVIGLVAVYILNKKRS